MANRVVGVDFGHGVVRGVEIDDPGTRRQRVVGTGAVPLDPETVVSGEVRDPGAVASTLKQLWSKSGFRAKRVVLGMGNSRVLARDLQVPVRPLPQIREGLQFLVADLLPMPLENAVLDYYPIATTTDANGIAMYEGMLIAALKDVVLQNAKAVRLAGLELVGVDLIPFALVRTLADPGSPETTAFIDVGATTTIIVFATGGVPEFVRIVPIGGEDITRSLMELGQLSRDQAEQIKRAVGLTADGVEARYRPVVELMIARSSELMTSIRDTIQYFSDTRSRRVAGIVLTGGGARLGHFAETVTAWSRVPAAIDGRFADPQFVVAGALATGARTTATERSAPPRWSAPAGDAPAGVDPAEPAAPADPGSNPLEDAAATAAPAVVASTPRGGRRPAKEPKAPREAKAPRESKPPKEKKDSIWTRPIGGGRK